MTDTTDKKARRAELERQLGLRQARLPKQLYGVIYADAPWRFEVHSRETGLDRSAENHYPTMTLEAIKEMRVPAAADAVLFSWVTVPHLKNGLDVMEAWGFAYKSSLLWVKEGNPGTGFWLRNRHEILLIGTRGRIPAPAPGDQLESVVMSAPKGRHSEKPDIVRDWIAELYPSLAKLEMFARKRTPGWGAWGNEVEGAP